MIADHPVCDDPACEICAARERTAAADLRNNPQINRTVAKLKEHAKRRARRPQG